MSNPARRRERTSKWPWSLALALMVSAVLFVLPVLMIAVGAFRTGSPGSTSGSWTLDGLRSVYSDTQAWSVLSDSLLFALGVSSCSTILAAYLAWLSTRTDTPLRGMITPIMVLIMVMPHLFFAVSWGLLGNEQVGGINRVFSSIAGHEVSPINVESWWGILFVASLKSTALKYMLLVGPMKAMDRSQEEAAFIAGASKTRTFVTITVPALAPATLGAFVLGLVVALEYFDIPLILGAATGVDVFSTEIYSYLFEQTPPQFTNASALALGAIILLVLLLTLQGRLLGEREFTTVRGKTSRQGGWQLGPWRFLGTVVIVAYTTLALVLPVAQLVIVSASPFLGVYDKFTFENYRTVLDDPAVVASIRTTLQLSLAGGVAAVLLALMITYVVRHHRGLGARFLRFSTWLPWSIPGTALGLGMLWAYFSIPGLRDLYGTSALVFIGLVVAATPLAMRSVEPGVGQVGAELEEAARISGAHQGRAFFDAVVRLVTPSLMAGGVLAAILVAGNLAIPIMLGSADSQTLPALIFQRYSAGGTVEAAALLCLLLVGIAFVAAVGAFLWSFVRWLRCSAAQRHDQGSRHAMAPSPNSSSVLASVHSAEKESV